VLQAMRFPAVQRVVYSTCSVHSEENEAVVATVLRQSAAGRTDDSWAPAVAAGGGLAVGHFEIAEALPDWHRRGLERAEWGWAARLVRCEGPADRTNGFFVAVFDRVRRPELGAPAAAALVQQPASSVKMPIVAALKGVAGRQAEKKRAKRKRQAERRRDGGGGAAPAAAVANDKEGGGAAPAAAAAASYESGGSTKAAKRKAKRKRQKVAKQRKAAEATDVAGDPSKKQRAA
jgi:hypothetical protein